MLQNYNKIGALSSDTAHIGVSVVAAVDVRELHVIGQALAMRYLKSIDLIMKQALTR